MIRDNVDVVLTTAFLLSILAALLVHGCSWELPEVPRLTERRDPTLYVCREEDVGTFVDVNCTPYTHSDGRCGLVRWPTDCAGDDGGQL